MLPRLVFFNRVNVRIADSEAPRQHTGAFGRCADFENLRRFQFGTALSFVKLCVRNTNGCHRAAFVEKENALPKWT